LYADLRHNLLLREGFSHRWRLMLLFPRQTIGFCSGKSFTCADIVVRILFANAVVVVEVIEIDIR
jgi:hypothetical protein